MVCKNAMIQCDDLSFDFCTNAESDNIDDYNMDDMEEMTRIFYDDSGDLLQYLDAEISSNIIGGAITDTGFCQCKNQTVLTLLWLVIQIHGMLGRFSGLIKHGTTFGDITFQDGRMVQDNKEKKWFAVTEHTKYSSTRKSEMAKYKYRSGQNMYEANVDGYDVYEVVSMHGDHNRLDGLEDDYSYSHNGYHNDDYRYNPQS